MNWKGKIGFQSSERCALLRRFIEFLSEIKTCAVFQEDDDEENADADVHTNISQVFLTMSIYLSQLIILLGCSSN